MRVVVSATRVVIVAVATMVGRTVMTAAVVPGTVMPAAVVSRTVMAAAVMSTAVVTATMMTATVRSGLCRQRQEQCCGDRRYECEAAQHSFHSLGSIGFCCCRMDMARRDA
jgi:hypothetical protein